MPARLQRPREEGRGVMSGCGNRRAPRLRECPSLPRRLPSSAGRYRISCRAARATGATPGSASWNTFAPSLAPRRPTEPRCPGRRGTARQQRCLGELRGVVYHTSPSGTRSAARQLRRNALKFNRSMQSFRFCGRSVLSRRS